MTDLQRIKIAITTLTSLGIAKNQEDVGRMLGYNSKSAFSQLLNGRVPIPANFISKLKALHHKVAELWDDDQEVIEIEGEITSLKRNVRTKRALIPFYNADFMAGNSDVFYEDGTIYPEYYMDVPEFYGCTAFRAYSDSMEPKIRSGAILFGVKVDDWRSSLEYGQIYGITLNDGRRFLKYIRRSSDYKNEFILKSENSAYDDFEVTKDKIKNIWLIEGWLDKRT